MNALQALDKKKFDELTANEKVIVTYHKDEALAQLAAAEFAKMQARLAAAEEVVRARRGNVLEFQNALDALEAALKAGAG